MTIISLGLFLLSRSDEVTPLPQIVGTLAIVGMGVGLFNAPNSSAVMGAVPSSQRGVAAAILSTARTLGNTLGLGLAGAIFLTVLGEAPLGDAAAVLPAVRTGFVTTSLLALVGAITSATRPSTRRAVD